MLRSIWKIGIMDFLQAAPDVNRTTTMLEPAQQDDLRFLDISLGKLDAMKGSELDALPFGVVGLTANGETAIYNATESAYAGLPRASVIGRPFFLATGVCMNNFLVAQRLEDEAELDTTLDYVLTFRMRPTPVRLRLLKGERARHRYILLQR